MKKKGLNQGSTNHYDQWVRIDTLNTKNPSPVGMRPVYQNRATQLNSDLITVAAVTARANADISGITGEKDAAKLTASQMWGVITGNAFSFAEENGMKDLKKQMLNATESKIVKTKDENFVGICTNLNTLLAKVLTDNPGAADYYVASDLSDATDAVTTFSGYLGTYAGAKVDVDGAKKEFKITWMPTMKTHIAVLQGLLGGAIKNKFPAFVISFLKLKKIVNAGKRDQGTVPVMVDSVTKKPFVNIATFETVNYIKVKKQKLNKSNSTGLLGLMSLRVGDWTILFKVPGYVDQKIIVSVAPGAVTKMVVEMVAIV